MGRQHTYRTTVRWTGDTGSGYRGYERAHDVLSEGKPTLAASADPAFRGGIRSAGIRRTCWSPRSRSATC